MRPRVPNFKRELKALKSRNEVRRFLREAVKALVVFALKNPGVLQDLKSRDCPEQTEPGHQTKELRRLAGITTRQLESVRESFEAMQELFAGIDRKDPNGSAPSRPR